MRAKVRCFYSSDVNLDDYVPPDPENVSVVVRMMVGPVGELGEESFDVVVCTPRWLAEEVGRIGPIIGRHHLIVQRFRFKEVRDFLTRRVESLEAQSWDELATKIGRLGYWEFEDYQTA